MPNQNDPERLPAGSGGRGCRFLGQDTAQPLPVGDVRAGAFLADRDYLGRAFPGYGFPLAGPAPELRRVLG